MMRAQKRQGEIISANARVWSTVYHVDRAARHIRRPTRDILALCTELVRDSSGYFTSDEGTSKLLALGSLIFIPAGTEIAAFGPGGSKRIIFCSLGQGFLLDGFDRNDARLLALCSDVRDPNIWNVMQRLGEEVMRPGPDSETLVEHLAMVLRTDFRRYLARGRLLATSTGALAPWQLSLIENFVYESEWQRIRLDEIASRLGISTGHLSRGFKSATGQTVHQWIAKVRLEKARILLRDRAIPLKQIASMLGFRSCASFSHSFRQSTGSTPSAFRTQSARAPRPGHHHVTASGSQAASAG